MMPFRPVLPCLVAFGFFCGLAGQAAEPRAAFALKKGWVEIELKQDGLPLADAIIQVIDERGGAFAQGQSGANGQGAFPMPRGESCVVEIKTGERTADPIRLYRTDDGIEPARVLLTYGLQPCCRFKSPREMAAAAGPAVIPAPAAGDPPRDWIWLGAALGGLSSAAGILVLTTRRHRPRATGTPSA